MIGIVSTSPDVRSAELALFGAIWTAYEDQLLGAGYTGEYIAAERRHWQQFCNYADGAPCWYWKPALMNRYSRGLRRHGCSKSEMRAKQGAVRRVLKFARDPGNRFDDECYRLTGRRIPQICTLANTVRHQRGANTTKRRRLTEPELNAFFDTIRAHIAKRLRLGPRAALAACMHYAFFCFCLAFGVRDFEAVMGDLNDLSPAISALLLRFSVYDDFEVRFGKRAFGSDYKRRSVPVMAIFADYLAAVADYFRETRPLLKRATSPDALFLSQRGKRIRADSMSALFHHYRERAGLSADLTLHCLRHTFETLLRENGVEIRTTQRLLGHDNPGSTLIYDHMSDEEIYERALEFNEQFLNECDRRYGDAA